MGDPCESPCSARDPLALTLGGPQREAVAGLVFTPDNPCGIELDAEGVETAPLVSLFRSTYCLGDIECPGARVLITGHVQARVRQGLAVPSTVTFAPFGGCTGASSEPLLKLAITPCGMSGPVIIDSDSEIVVPAGSTQIEVLGPADWHNMGQAPATEAGWTDVSLKVSACPLDCCYCPEGFLTEWLRVMRVGEDSASRMLVRPRRARRMQAAIASFTAVTIDFFHEPTGTVGPLASVNIAPLGQETFDPWGASPYLRIAAADTFTALLRWGVK